MKCKYLTRLPSKHEIVIDVVNSPKLFVRHIKPSISHIFILPESKYNVFGVSVLAVWCSSGEENRMIHTVDLRHQMRTVAKFHLKFHQAFDDACGVTVKFVH